MQSAFPVTIGPFDKGLSNVLAPHLLDASAAVVAENVDLSAGTLRGSWGLGATAATVAADAKFACWIPYAGGGGSIVSTAQPDWYCDIGDIESIGLRVAVRTALPGVPKLLYGGAITRDLGVQAPDPITAVDGSGGNPRTYALVYQADSEVPILSNPSLVKVGALEYAVLTIGAKPAGVHKRHIYVTTTGDHGGPLYYYETITDDSATTYTDDGGPGGSGWPGAWAPGNPIDPTLPESIGWAAGGNPGTPATPYDHSPPPPLSVIAPGLYGGVSLEAGVLFGAARNKVQWSATGAPWFWPTSHFQQVQGNVEAFAIADGQVYAFTVEGVWSFSGGADYAIYASKTNAAPIKAGWGKSAVATPYGVVYATREGLAVLRGGQSELLDTGVKWGDLADYAYATADFIDGSYYLAPWGAGFVYRVDLEHGMRATKELHDVACFIDAGTLALPAGFAAPTVFAVDKASGAVKPWRPADEGAGGVSRQAWRWKTPLLTCGEPNKDKRFRRVRVDRNRAGTVTLTATIYRGGLGGAPEYAFTRTLKPGCDLFWLPSSFDGRAMQIEMSGTADAEVYGLEVYGGMLSVVRA